MKEEVMNDAMDDAMEDEGDEEETYECIIFQFKLRSEIFILLFFCKCIFFN